MQQLSLRIETPDQHARALHPHGTGKVTIGRKTEKGRWSQSSYSIEHLPKIVQMLHGQPDIFISQNRFYGSRLLARLAQLDALFADLDYYRVSSLREHTPEQVHALALEKLADANLPSPSLAIATGRGVALIWLHDAVPRQALPRWNACQKHLFETLKPLGADHQALDAARVLRLVGTLNNTAKTMVRALHDLRPSAWDFDTLAEEILPFSRAEIHSLTLERTLRKQLRTNRPPQQFTAATLWEGRLAELQALRQYRHELGKLPPGQRSSWLFIAGVAMSWLAPPSAMQRELYGLAREVAGWSDAESKTRMQAAISRAKMAAKGETVEWNGTRIDARYQFKDKTIIEWLSITDEEMEKLQFKHLVHQQLKQERHRAKAKEYMQKKRRTEGALDREEYEQQAILRRQQAYELRQQGLNWQKVGEAMNISPAAARKLASRFESQKRTSPLHCMVAKPTPSNLSACEGSRRME